jgi:hypothetical protein
MTFNSSNFRLKIGSGGGTTGNFSSVTGGNTNCIVSTCSHIGGGNSNCVKATQNYRSVIGGGSSNCICVTGTNIGHNATIGGGNGNRIRSAAFSFIGGGNNNNVNGTGTSSCSAVIGGGSTNTINFSCCSVITGGFSNGIGQACFTFIGGGRNNCIDRACQSGILGGCGNKICTGHHKSMIIGNNLVTCTSCTTYVNNLRVNGNISKSGGSFSIDHPNPAKTKTHRLVHGFVESATAGDNIYRFVVEIKNLKAIIKLPDYYKYLNEDDQIWVNSKDHFGMAYGKINKKQSELTIFSNKDGFYNVLLIGTRKDEYVKKYWNGVEPLKSKGELAADKEERLGTSE